jgi:isoprenylcysteine carboxyl methyltransferase (ICMT) family protein YpbQ
VDNLRSPFAPTDGCPRSATHPRVALAGLLGFLVACWLVIAYEPLGGDIAASALLVIASTGAVILGLDIGWLKVHRRSSTGLDWQYDDPSWRRSLLKLLGLLLSLGGVALLYWLFPYYHQTRFEPYYALLKMLLPAWLLLALPYFHFVDRHMREPHDGYWLLGQCLFSAVIDRKRPSLRAADLAVLYQHLLGWLIKGFFLPLMFIYFCNYLQSFNNNTAASALQFWFELLCNLAFLIDVGLVSMGYLLTLRLADTHVRSAEPTLSGWVAALACYEPFWFLMARQYLQYQGKLDWLQWLGDSPLLATLWAAMIVTLVMIYAWATVIFCARFSNLTHRGIITNGPYRFTRHPAYLAKNLSWWLISIPFIVQDSATDALRHCLMLLLLNALYALRAWTEERHLSQDPQYVQYAAWIRQHGLFRRFSAARAGVRM